MPNYMISSSRTSRSRHNLLLAMAKDAKRLAEQARRIAELRARKRVTQPDVAEAVGVTLRAYQAWEHGDSDPKGSNVTALADYFGTTADFIEFGSEMPAKPVPDLMPQLARNPSTVQLDRIEIKLDALLGQQLSADQQASLARRVSVAWASTKRS
jgi:transcriptional regulator with XRE-family HTH domain